MTTTQPVGKVYVSGNGLSDIRILDPEILDEVDRIPTDTDDNYRLVISDYLEEEEMNLVAFSEYDRSADQSHVYIHNSLTNERLSQIVHVPGFYFLEIEILSSFSSSSTPIIVSAYEDHLCAYNSLTTEKLIDCQNLTFTHIYRIKCFPEWNLNEVFIGGMKRPNGLLHRYDLNQDCVMLGSYVGHVGSISSYVNGITASLTDEILISGSIDGISKGTLKVWSKDTFECIESVDLDYACYSLDYCSDSHLVCCGTFNEIEIFDIRNMRNRLRKVENVGNGGVNDLDSISNSSLFVSGDSNGYVSIWNPLTGKVLREIKVGGCIFGIRFLPSLIQQLEMRRIEQEREEQRLEEERIRQQREEAERERIRIEEEEQRAEALKRLAQERQQAEYENRLLPSVHSPSLVPDSSSHRGDDTPQDEMDQLRREGAERLRLLQEEVSRREAVERLLTEEREESQRQLQEEREEKERLQREAEETEVELREQNTNLEDELKRIREENDRLRKNEEKTLRQLQEETCKTEEAEKRLAAEAEDKRQIQREAEETERRMSEEINSVRNQLKSRNDDFSGLENELSLLREECSGLETEKSQLQTESRVHQTNIEELTHRIIALTDRLGIEPNEEEDEKPFVVRIISPPDSILVRGDRIKFEVTSVVDSTRIQSVRFGPMSLFEEEENGEEPRSLLEVECRNLRLRPETYPLTVNDIEIERFDVVSGEAMTYYAVVHESLTLESLSCLVRCEVRRGVFRRISNLFGLSDEAVGGEIEPLRSAIEDFAGVAVNDCELVRNRWIEVRLRPKKARKVQRQDRHFMVQGVDGEKRHVVTLEREPPTHFVLQTDVVETPGSAGVISRVGASGIVRHGVLDIGPTSFEVAIKKQWFEYNDRYPDSLLDAEREVKMMCECEHPNVLRCRGCYVIRDDPQDDRGVTLVILTDFCSDGTVLHWLRRKKRNGTLHNADKISCLEQTAAGMLYLHTKGLIHRDLKPDNALMKNGQVKICDLGFTRHRHSLISRTVKGTPEYMSREVKQVLSTPIPNDQMFLVDVYAFGICMWAIWNLKEPYGDVKDALVRQNIDVSLGLLNLVHPPVGSGRESIRPDVDECDGMPQELVDLMIRCWDDDLTVRPEFAEIVKVFGESY